MELDIRTVKETLHLDVLRCKTPEMVRKELRTGILVYNLIRQTIVEAAIAAGRSQYHSTRIVKCLENAANNRGDPSTSHHVTTITNAARAQCVYAR